MRTGMLWFDDDPRAALEQKVAKAVIHYQRTRGQLPNLCLVNAGALNGGGKRNAGPVEIRAGKSVLRDHFFLGVEVVR